MRKRVEQLSARLSGLKHDAKNGDGQQHENASHEHLEIDARGIDWQIGELCDALNKATLVNPPISTDRVTIGTQVKIRIDNKEEETWLIAGYGESDPDEGVIAYNTPLAEAIMDASEGACLARVLASREVDIEIIEISLPTNATKKELTSA